MLQLKHISFLFAISLVQISCANNAPVPNALAEAPPPRAALYKVNIKPRHAIVEVRFRSPPSDPLPIKIHANPEHVYDLRAEISGNAIPLQVTRRGDNSWDIRGAGQRDLTIRYLIIDQRTSLTSAAHGEAMPPLTTEKSFYGLGESLLIIPDFQENLLEFAQVQIVTDDGWPVWTSWGRAAIRVRDPMDLRQQLIIAGDWRVHQRSGAGTLVQIATPAGSQLKPGDFQGQLEGFMRTHSEIFGSYPWNTILMVLAPDPEERVVAHRGGFTVLAPDTVLNTPRRSGKALATAHFSLWTSAIAPLQEDLEWFSTGVIGYYGVRTLIRLRIFSQEDFKDEVNGWLREYYELLKSEAPSPQEARRLAQLRGRVIAFILDVELRAESLGTTTLDHLMRKMFLDFSNNGASVSNDEILSRLKLLSRQDWGPFFKDVITPPRPELPVERLNSAGILCRYQSAQHYELGFSTHEPDLKNATVTQVTANSEAARAGLKAGDIVKTFTHTKDSPETPVKMVIERPGARDPIPLEFMPVATTQVPQIEDLGPLLWEWLGP